MAQILLMGKMRSGEIRKCVQGHKAYKWWRWEWNLCSLELASDLDTELWQPLPELESVLNFKEETSSTLSYLSFGFKLLGNTLFSSVCGNWA